MPNQKASTVAMALLAATLGFADTASADDALRIAKRGGFLLGQAYRCGAPVEHLDGPAKLIQNLLNAAAATSEEKTTADQTFAEQLLLNVVTPGHAGLLPSCGRVRRELARLTEHPTPTPSRGSSDVLVTQSPARLAKASRGSVPAQERNADRSHHN